jgi:hypothetical protein
MFANWMNKFPYSTSFYPHLSSYFEEAQAKRILSEIQKTYIELVKTTSQAAHGSQWRLFLKRVAPAIAIYTVLGKEEIASAKAIEWIDTLFQEVLFKVQKQGMKLVGKLPDPYPLVRYSLRAMSRNSYLPNSEQIIEDSDNCFAMNVKRCYYFDMMQRYNVPELTACFCHTDDWLSAMMPKVTWHRTSTLAQGTDHCDFRWCRDLNNKKATL